MAGPEYSGLFTFCRKSDILAVGEGGEADSMTRLSFNGVLKLETVGFECLLFCDDNIFISWGQLKLNGLQKTLYFDVQFK